MRKVSLAVSISILLVLGLDLSASSANSTDDPGYFLFTSFKANGDGLHLAISQDGYHWTALNKDNLFLKPTIGTEKLMRDPCIVQAADGTFHMVWTTGWYVRDIGYASSKDLIHWSEQTQIPVMGHEPTARNSWAPELYFDEFKKQWLI